jgi:hypothetical protein
MRHRSSLLKAFAVLAFGAWRLSQPATAFAAAANNCNTQFCSDSCDDGGKCDGCTVSCTPAGGWPCLTGFTVECGAAS